MCDRYPTFHLEEQGFVESLEICNSTEISAEKIYYTIRDSDEIPENLKLMYKEAVFGYNEKVKKCIKHRINNIRRSHKYGVHHIYLELSIVCIIRIMFTFHYKFFSSAKQIRR